MVDVVIFVVVKHDDEKNDDVNQECFGNSFRLLLLFLRFVDRWRSNNGDDAKDEELDDDRCDNVT
jgi:hypothetical protein